MPTVYVRECHQKLLIAIDKKKELMGWCFGVGLGLAGRIDSIRVALLRCAGRARHLVAEVQSIDRLVILTLAVVDKIVDGDDGEGGSVQ